jgi:hypothetical protein
LRADDQPRQLHESFSDCLFQKRPFYHARFNVAVENLWNVGLQAEGHNAISTALAASGLVLK